jgi:hypothetical protein
MADFEMNPAVPLVGNPVLSKIAAVGLGTLVVFGAAALVARLQRKATV